MSKADDLAKLALFRGLARRDLDLIARHVDEVSLAAGQTLITQGNSNHALYILQSGEVEVRVGDQPRRRMGPGEFFGEISMDSYADATATVVVTAPGRAWVIGRAQFGALAGKEPVLLKLKSAIADHLMEDRANTPRS